MKIECIIRRKAGTTVVLGKTEYKFRPIRTVDPKTDEYKIVPHVCEVGEEAHVAKLLTIPEAYRIYDPEGKLMKKSTDEVKGTKDPEDETGSETDDDPYAGISDDELRAKITEKTGRQPHPNAKRPKLVEYMNAIANLDAKRTDEEKISEQVTA